MKAIAKVRPSRGLTLINVAEPNIVEDDDVVIEVISSSICGTDLHIYEWDEAIRDRIHFPRIIGHEMVGRVIKTGRGVKNLDYGDIVAGESHIPCQNCYYCRTGRMHICKNLKVLGMDIDGCFANYCRSKEISLWKLDAKINYEYASALEPLGNAVHAISEINPRAKDILVYGCGPIGIASIYFLKKLGAKKVVGVDISKFRLDMAKKFGADAVINAKEEIVERKAREIIGEGFDVLLEMSGSQDGFSKGLRLLKPNSLAIFFGLPAKHVYLNVVNDVILKETTIKGVFGRKMFETWYELEKYLNEFGFPFEDFITHKFKLEDFEEAFETLKSGNCGKIILKP